MTIRKKVLAAACVAAGSLTLGLLLPAVDVDHVVRVDYLACRGAEAVVIIGVDTWYPPPSWWPGLPLAGRPRSVALHVDVNRPAQSGSTDRPGPCNLELQAGELRWECWRWVQGPRDALSWTDAGWRSGTPHARARGAAAWSVHEPDFQELRHGPMACPSWPGQTLVLSGTRRSHELLLRSAGREQEEDTVLWRGPEPERVSILEALAETREYRREWREAKRRLRR